MHKCTHAHTCACTFNACTHDTNSGQRTTSGVCSQEPCTFCLKSGLLLTRYWHLNQASWPLGFQGSDCLCLPSHHHWDHHSATKQCSQLKWVLEIQAQVLEVLCQLCHPPNLEIFHKYRYKQIEMEIKIDREI